MLFIFAFLNILEIFCNAIQMFPSFRAERYMLKYIKEENTMLLAKLQFKIANWVFWNAIFDWPF